MTKYITSKQAAALLGVTPQRVAQLIVAGIIPATKHGRDWMISSPWITKNLDRLRGRKPGRPKAGG